MNQVPNEGFNPIDSSIKDLVGRGDVLLLVSPLVLSKGPLFALHLLQACCRRQGIIAPTLYCNLLYANQISLPVHNLIVGDDAVFIGERLFAEAAFNIPGVSGSMDKLANPGWIPDYRWPITRKSINLQAPDVVTSFRKWLDTVDWKQLESITTKWTRSVSRQIADLGYSIIGCSTSSGGLVPAVALLHCIKESAPHVITVLGGPLCEEEMAEGVLSLNAGIDYIFSGEGETTFPDFVQKVLGGDLPGERIIYGEAVKNLDSLPLPDYREYFEQRNKLDLDGDSLTNVIIPYETSRGCWHNQCTFCALNGKKNFYRTKSPDKIIGDLKTLMKKNSSDSLVFMTDLIMPLAFFDTLLPRIAREISSLNFSYEIKANLTLDQVISLKKAGVAEIQPGIESLSSSLLKRMQKRVTVGENIRLLRCARSVNIPVRWFLLVGLPGDQAGEYEEMLHLLPLIHHLQPPGNIVPLKLCRFSKYQTSPERFGISHFGPAEFYKDIFPSDACLDKIAFYLTADFPCQSHDHPEVINALDEEYRAWYRSWDTYRMVPLEMMRPTLHITRKTDNKYVLIDTRGLPEQPKQMEIHREQAAILLTGGAGKSSSEFQWALDAKLGFFAESRFIPLATADPTLLQEFEREYGHSRAYTAN